MKTMHNDEFFIEKTIRLFEEQTGWEDSAEWTNQDFMTLSEKIQDKTGVALSHVTLKRVWGKVKYDSLPNTHTLNTLVQFLGFDNWRDFSVRYAGSDHPAAGEGLVAGGPLNSGASQNGNGAAQTTTIKLQPPPAEGSGAEKEDPETAREGRMRKII